MATQSLKAREKYSIKELPIFTSLSL